MGTDDLFGQCVIENIVIDGHAKITGDPEGRMFIVVFNLEDLIHGVGEPIQRGDGHAQSVLVCQDAPVHAADFTQRIGQWTLQTWRIHHVMDALQEG